MDVPTFEEAGKYIRLLSEYVGIFKVGLEMFIQSGHDIIKLIKESGDADIFLDLKLHDIPSTVHRAMERIARMDVRFATVHCGESKKMLEAAVEGSKGKVEVLGVTVLTSIGPDDIRSAGYNEEFSLDLSKLAMKRASNAKEAGCAGVVCSGHEVERIKKNFGDDFLAVTPGIRPDWDGVKKDDQQRVTTPAQAVKNGSDYLVIGRPVRDAKNPAEAAVRIANEVDAVLDFQCKAMGTFGKLKG